MAARQPATEDRDSALHVRIVRLLAILPPVAVLLVAVSAPPHARAQPRPVYRVTAYGATGDGMTDDTAAIYATFRAAPPGAEVFFPPGTYTMDPRSPDNRVIKSHTLVRGVSAASVLRLGTGALDGGNFGQNDILLRNANPGTGNDDIQVVGLTIDGNARGNPGPLVVEGFPLYFARVRGLVDRGRDHRRREGRSPGDPALRCRGRSGKPHVPQRAGLLQRDAGRPVRRRRPLSGARDVRATERRRDPGER